MKLFKKVKFYGPVKIQTNIYESGKFEMGSKWLVENTIAVRLTANYPFHRFRVIGLGNGDVLTEQESRQSFPLLLPCFSHFEFRYLAKIAFGDSLFQSKKRKQNSWQK